jgi:hypothetical protein
MEYWSRLWIIQEVALAHKMLLYCGRGTIDRKSFDTVLYELKKRERFHTHTDIKSFMISAALVRDDFPTSLQRQERRPRGSPGT